MNDIKKPNGSVEKLLNIMDKLHTLC